ncbi:MULTISPECIES: helix-turn-helix domain-containing protein [Pseudomonas]|uniref:helix-turn-helix domain-containing protein n=1 Tax=Pseudomonas TaxID=286 RepID=UPI0008EF514F|nr:MULTISPECIES: helix-turn-helix domain-containing protein [Pseudomonas]SFU17882.1 Helix-turn-helix domain-containing protein [Pseudomonas marincola]
MSIKLMGEVWGLSFSPQTKIIVLALAFRSDKKSQCWPKVSTIAAMVGYSERTVQRVLRELEAIGIIRVTPRFQDNGRQTSNTYQLVFKTQGLDVVSAPHATSKRASKMMGLSGGRVSSLGHGGDDKIVSCLQPTEDTSDFNKRIQTLPLSEVDRSDVIDILGALSEPLALELVEILAKALRGRKIRRGVVPWLQGVVRKRTYNGASVQLLRQKYVEEMKRRGLSESDARMIAEATVY